MNMQWSMHVRTILDPFGGDPVKTISMRDLQKHLRDCVHAAQRDRVVVTRRGAPTALIIGVEGSDWETLMLQTSPSFWRMIERRRKEKTMTSHELRQRLNIKRKRREPSA